MHSPKRPRRPARTTADMKRVAGFTAEEREAMRERAREVKAQARRGPGSAEDGEREVRAKIAQMQGRDRALAERLHALVRASAPALVPTTWYGMPAYARDGKVVCYFQPAGKFKTRYATVGFTDAARLDAGSWWPVAFALTELTPAVEATISALIQKAVS